MLYLPPEHRLTPDQFEMVCANNRQVVLELAADGCVIWMTPRGGEASLRNGRLGMRLQLWADQQSGWSVLESSGGLCLSDGSVFSLDAFLVSLERWQGLTPEQRRGFAMRCTDLLV